MNLISCHYEHFAEESVLNIKYGSASYHEHDSQCMNQTHFDSLHICHALLFFATLFISQQTDHMIFAVIPIGSCCIAFLIICIVNFSLLCWMSSDLSCFCRSPAFIKCMTFGLFLAVNRCQWMWSLAEYTTSLWLHFDLHTNPNLIYYIVQIVRFGLVCIKSLYVENSMPRVSG